MQVALIDTLAKCQKRAETKCEDIETISTEFSEDRKEAESRLKNAWQNYCEAGDELDANSPMNKRAARLSSVEDETMLPLPDDVLTRNLGLDIVVVVTKVAFLSKICCFRPFFQDQPILILSTWILSNRRTTWQHWRRSTTTEMSISISCSSGFGAFVCSTVPRCSTPALRRTKTVICCTSIWRTESMGCRSERQPWSSKKMQF